MSPPGRGAGGTENPGLGTQGREPGRRSPSGAVAPRSKLSAWVSGVMVKHTTQEPRFLTGNAS